VHCDFYRLGIEEAARLEPELTEVLNKGQSLVIAEWAELAEFLHPAISHWLKFELDPAGVTRTLKMEVMKHELLKSFTKGS
jgi:tRNA A37 threonylcarbamoyladenosine biosynthesis protein TsaE